MDAKPQRPLGRTIRVHNDENMPPTTGPIGKTLHQRTKSTSALGGIAALQKKNVLGESNTNLKIAPKDDSEIGKASPAKLRIFQEAEGASVRAPFLKPALRPSIKSSASQDMHVATKAHAVPITEVLPKRVIPKKSKVLRDVVPAVRDDVGPTTSAVLIPPQPTTEQASREPVLTTKASTNAFQLQHRVEGVPLRDEPIPQQQRQVTNSSIDQQQIIPVVPAQPTQYEYLPQSFVQPQLELCMPAASSDPSTVLPVTAQREDPEPDFEDEDQDYVTAQSFDLRLDATETAIFNPQHSKKQRAEIAEAKAWVDANRTVDDIEDEQWDTSMVAEYGDEIFEYMRETETRMAPNPYYMDQQTEIQWSMRAVLMDWVVQVHQRFNLLPETLFLTINYIDRFLSCKIVSLGKLQLVGATAIFVAAKYEEVNCPTISEIIYMVDNGYTADELLKAERFMLTMLQFELGWPGPMSFLRRISKADDYDLETRTLAKYFLEVTIMDERFVGCKPSFLAAGAHCMARLMLRKGDWTKAHVYYSNYTYRQLHRLLGAMYECCIEAQKHHAAVFEKYTDKRYKRASTFVRAEVLRGFQLPFSYQGGSFGLQHSGSNWLVQ